MCVKTGSTSSKGSSDFGSKNNLSCKWSYMLKNHSIAHAHCNIFYDHFGVSLPSSQTPKEVN